MTSKEEFGLFLKEELTKKTNLNSSQLASILNCSRSTLNDLFKGKRSLSKAFAKRIETAFSSNFLSPNISIKADDLLKKQAALIYKISGETLNLDEDEDTQSSQDKDYIDSSRDPSDEKFPFSKNTPESSKITTIQDQAIPFFAKFTKEKIESYVDNNEQKCRGLIPELVYTLIATTTRQDYLEKFYLPYGDDISLKGFDGIVSYSQNHPYIPKGLSVWEIGTNKDPKRKFDEDFSKAKEKLSKLSQDVDIHDVTYVAVFPRTISYQNQENWIRQKKKEGSEFKDIRIIDAFLLAQWANQSVSAQLHFSKQFSNFEEDDLLTNIETSQFMYKEMCFDRIEHGEELLNDLFSLYQNDYYDLFKSFIRTGLDGNILKAASESKILTKAFICYLAKVYDYEDKNNSTDGTVSGIEYQVKATLQDNDEENHHKDTDFDEYQKSRYTNLFLNTYYIKDYALLAKLILALKVLSILIVDEEIIDDRIKELCKENKNVRIITIRNLYNFDISDPYKESSSIAERSEIFLNTNSVPSFKEEIILNPLTWYKIENTLNEFTQKTNYLSKKSYEEKGSTQNKTQEQNKNADAIFNPNSCRHLALLSEGSISNLRNILTKGTDFKVTRRHFNQNLIEQNEDLSFLFCFCQIGKINTKDSLQVEVLKSLYSKKTEDIEQMLTKIIHLKLSQSIACFYKGIYKLTSRYIVLDYINDEPTINKEDILNRLYNIIESLIYLKITSETGIFFERNCITNQESFAYYSAFLSVLKLQKETESTNRRRSLHSNCVIDELTQLIIRLLDVLCFKKEDILGDDYPYYLKNKALQNNIFNALKANSNNNNKQYSILSAIRPFIEQLSYLDCRNYLNIVDDLILSYCKRAKIEKANDLYDYCNPYLSDDLLYSLFFVSKKMTNLKQVTELLIQLDETMQSSDSSSYNKITELLGLMFDIYSCSNTRAVDSRERILKELSSKYPGPCKNLVIEQIKQITLGGLITCMPSFKWYDLNIKLSQSPDTIRYGLDRYIYLYLSLITTSNLSFDELAKCKNFVEFMSEEQLQKLESLIELYSKDSTEEKQIELRDLFNQKQFWLHQKVNISERQKEFFKKVRTILESKSMLLKDKWKVEAIASDLIIDESIIPVEVITKFKNKDKLKDYIHKERSDFIYKTFKKLRGEGLKWIFKNCKNTYDIGYSLVKDHELSLNDRLYLFTFFINEIYLTNKELNSIKELDTEVKQEHSDSNLLSKILLSSKRDSLTQSNFQNQKVSQLDKYLTDCRSCIWSMSSIDKGFNLKRAYGDYVKKNNLSISEEVNILINFPFDECTFELAERTRDLAAEYWDKVPLLNYYKNLENKETFEKIQSCLKKADRLIELCCACMSFLVRTNDYKEFSLECVLETVDTINKINLYKFQNKIDLLKSDEQDLNIRKNDEIENRQLIVQNTEDNNSVKYQNKLKCKEKAIIELQKDRVLLTKFVAKVLKESSLSFENKVLIELQILPYLRYDNFSHLLNASEEQLICIRELNLYFSANPQKYFEIFCKNYQHNHCILLKKDKLFTNENCVISVGNLEKDFPVYKFDPDTVICLESTELIFNNLNCIPGFCYAQIPDHNLISRWINQVIEISRNSKIDDLINITKNNVAKTLALTPKENNNLMPYKEVCLVLEDVEDYDFLRYFYIAFFNSYSLANIYQCDDGERNRNLAAEYKKIRISINKDEMPLTYNLVSMLENGYKFDSRHDNEDYIFRTYFET
mgnify:CR=1 FL=1